MPQEERELEICVDDCRFSVVDSGSASVERREECDVMTSGALAVMYEM